MQIDYTQPARRFNVLVDDKRRWWLEHYGRRIAGKDRWAPSVAKVLDVQSRTVNMWANGDRSVPIYALVALASLIALDDAQGKLEGVRQALLNTDL